jgi:hypothetical protein
MYVGKEVEADYEVGWLEQALKSELQKVKRNNSNYDCDNPGLDNYGFSLHF